MTTTSLTLLQRVRKRDDAAAWKQFVQLYTPLLYRWSQRAGLAEQDAVDLIQDVFTRLTVELPRFEYDAARGSFRGWLKAVTIHLCRERQRKPSREQARGGADNTLQQVAGTDELEAYWDAEYHAHLVREALEVMHQQFEPRLWQCCWELTVEGHSAKAIGARLGMSEAAVYVAKFRVLRHLRQELRGLLD